MSWRIIRARVKGGKATPTPPLGPAISQYGLDVNEVINKINEATKDYGDLEVTVEILVNPETKNYKINVKSPTTTSLLLKFAGALEPSGDPAHKKVGDVKFEDIVKIAILKKHDLTAKTLKAAVKTILSSAATIGVTVEGKEPKEVLREVTEGKYDPILLKYEEDWRKK